MKNVQMIIGLIFISGLFLTASAQHNKWEIGTSITGVGLNFNQNPGNTANNGRMEIDFATPVIYTSHTFNSQFEIGVGYGATKLGYELDIDRSVHRLDSEINFSDAPDRSKTPYKLNKVSYNSQYHNVPIFAKIRLLKKKKNWVFQPAIGLRLDNYFLKKSSIQYEFQRPTNSGGGGSGDLLGSLLLSVLWGEFVWIGGNDNDEPPIEIDELTSSQRAEIQTYYENQNKNYFSSISPTFHADLYFKHLSIGIEHFFTFPPSKVNSLLYSKMGIGIKCRIAYSF